MTNHISREKRFGIFKCLENTGDRYFLSGLVI